MWRRKSAIDCNRLRWNVVVVMWGKCALDGSRLLGVVETLMILKLSPIQLKSYLPLPPSGLFQLRPDFMPSALILLDGSHSFVASHTGAHKNKWQGDNMTAAFAESMCSFILQLNGKVIETTRRRYMTRR